jgi:hypothetical protein
MTTKKIKSTESKSDSEVVMTVDKKLKFENNTLDTLEAVNTALAYFAEQVSTLENKRFVDSLFLNVKSLDKKISAEIIVAKNRTILKGVRQAIKEGKTINIT